MEKNYKFTYLYKIIDAIFVLGSVMVIYSILAWDVRSTNPFPASVSLPNYVYFAIALIIIFCIYWLNGITTRIDSKYRDRLFLIAIIIIPLCIFAFWQLPVCNWIYYYDNDWDMGSIYQAALGLREGKTFAQFPYFYSNPNNVNIAIFASYIYSILGSWRRVIILQAALANISCVLATLIVYKNGRKLLNSLCLLIGSEILIAMTWRAYLVYSDVFGMFFLTLAIFLLECIDYDLIRIPLALIFFMLGIYVKITVGICMIIALFFCIIELIHREDSKRYKLLSFLIMILLSFVLLLLAENSMKNKYDFSTEGKIPKSWQYMLFLGQNTEACGTVNREDEAYYYELSHDGSYTADEVNDILFENAIKRIKERGIPGNCIFYLKKIHTAYCDGYFDNTQTKDLDVVTNELTNNKLYNLYVKEDGKWYQFSAAIMQILWNMILIVVFGLGSYEALRREGKSSGNIQYEAMIFAITLYLLIFEDRSKYLFMFLPVFVIYFGQLLKALEKTRGK